MLNVFLLTQKNPNKT